MKKNIFYLLIILFVAFACQVSNKKQAAIIADKEVVEVKFKVEGMTCDHCEMSIQKGVNGLPGIEMVLANYEDSTTLVKFDKQQTKEEEIKKAIEKRGYQVKGRIN